MIGAAKVNQMRAHVSDSDTVAALRKFLSVGTLVGVAPTNVGGKSEVIVRGSIVKPTNTTFSF